MNDTPYTTPDEDPFNIQPLQPRRRRSSLLNKWIQEQQNQLPESDATPAPEDHPSPARITPYLAYPDLTLEQATARDEILTTDGYDLVEDDDIPQSLASTLELPSTPTTARSRRTSRLLHTPSSFRSFNLSFKSASPAGSQPPDGGSPRPSSRLSLFPRSPRHSTDATTGRNTPNQHNRSSSLSTLNLAGRSVISTEIPRPGSSSRWRPSVLGHFSSSATSQYSVAPSETVYTPSRPSVSSGDTYTSTATATTTDYDLPLTPPKMNFMDSLRSRSRSQGSVFKAESGIESSSSIWSQNGDIPYSGTHGRSMSASQIASSSTSTLAHRVNSKRIPLVPKPGSRLANSNTDYDDDEEEDDDSNIIVKPIKYDPTRPHIAYSSGGTLPRVKFATLTSRQKKKKKLVVMGVAHEDERKFAGVKRWCESFGEVSQITRMPNGDLHVHFRLAEVADTVCRLRAKRVLAVFNSHGMRVINDNTAIFSSPSISVTCIMAHPRLPTIFSHPNSSAVIITRPSSHPFMLLHDLATEMKLCQPYVNRHYIPTCTTHHAISYSPRLALRAPQRSIPLITQSNSNCNSCYDFTYVQFRLTLYLPRTTHEPFSLRTLCT